jgi:hypothetical protein
VTTNTAEQWLQYNGFCSETGDLLRRPADTLL